ncbi:circularly permuted type 2 ATP-grasp protein [Micromonospora sp. M12]
MLSSGPGDPAWFEHRLLADEMGVPLTETSDLLVEEVGSDWSARAAAARST